MNFFRVEILKAQLEVERLEKQYKRARTPQSRGRIAALYFSAQSRIQAAEEVMFEHDTGIIA